MEPDPDVAGDGGETFAQVAASIESVENFHNLPVLVYKDGSGEIVHRGLAYSTFSKPSRLEELDLIRYEQTGFGIGIVTKLGVVVQRKYPVKCSGKMAADLVLSG